MNVAAVGGEEFLLVGEVFTVAGDNALRVEHQDVFLLSTDGHIEFGTADGGSTGTVDHNLHFLDILAYDLKRILQTGSRDDGRAVLVVVHHGDVECALQPFFDIETFGSLDVLQVDAAECGGNLLNCLAELLGVFFVHLDVEYVDTAVDQLNSSPLPSMTGFPLTAPMSPSPSTAVPFEITATRLPLSVYL